MVNSSFQADQKNHEHCNCGRISNIIKQHCPNCGSYYIYAITIYPDLTGKSTKAELRRLGLNKQGFRCRKCGLAFTKDIPCHAPFNDKINNKTAAKRGEVTAISDSDKVRQEILGNIDSNKEQKLKELFKDIKIEEK